MDKALAGVRLTSDDCTALLESHDVARIGVAADEIRQRRHTDNVVTYIIDRNINYTNVCNVVCTFCAFYRRPGAPDTYVRTLPEICEKIDETIALGGTGVLMQGGLHPDFGIEWYEDFGERADVSVGRARSPIESTEGANNVADVRVVDIAIDDVGDDVVGVAALANLVGRHADARDIVRLEQRGAIV